MELNLFSLSPLRLFGSNCCRTVLLPWQETRSRQVQSKGDCFSIVLKISEVQVSERRSAHYHPSIWDPKLIESLRTPYTYELHATRLEKLKEDAKGLLKSSRDHSIQLKLIDSMQRLGVAYHFEDEIKEAIDPVDLDVTRDLYTTALQFRLLRELGRPVSSDVFDKFRDREGRFMDGLSHDLAGLLSLYEASYLGMHGEDNLEEAKKFSIKHLKSSVGNLETNLAKQVQQSLEIPRHWRMPRAEVRNFIDIYEKDDTRSSVLLELAKLDYNIVQSVYQTELKDLARWWRDLGFKEKLSFSRDRLMENYLWAMGIIFKPQFSKCRIGLTKFVCILTAIDDMYDIYGSLDELERFSNAVDRWEIKAMEELPEYMRICYLAMFNFGNGMAYDALKNHGLDILPFIKEQWANLCKSYLVEARWFYDGHKPTAKEYLDNAWTSVGGPAAMVHAYFLQECTITKDLVNCFKHGSEMIYWSSLITRLSDDLGTSKAEIARGDVIKSIHCYMIEERITEEQAQDRIKGLIDYSWKKLNEETSARNYSLPKFMIDTSVNMARTAQFIFQHGDGIGESEGATKDRLISLIIKPIQIDRAN